MRGGVRNHSKCDDSGTLGLCLKRTSTLIMLGLAAAALAACSLPWGGGQAPAPPPSTPSVAQQQDGTPTPMDTFRTLAPPEGMKFTALFTEPADDRIGRLENVVQTLRNDFDTVVPTMVRLVAIEKDIKELVQQLQTLAEAPPPPAPPVIPSEDVVGGTESAVKADTTAPTSLVTPEAAPKGELPPEGAASPYSPPADLPPVTGAVKGVRVGDHLDKTRLVLDMTSTTEYTARLENGGQRLVVEAKNMDWSAIKPYVASRGELVSGYQVDGRKLVVNLLYPSQIKLKQWFPPHGKPWDRLVIDLHSADVHQ